MFINFLRKVYKDKVWSSRIRRILPWRILVAWEKAIFHIDRDVARKSVGPGWAGLIHEAYDLIDLSRPFGVSVTQVKEKYGTLRIYISSASTIFFDALEEICDKSAITCEDCGNPGYTRWHLGWVRTICDRCLVDKQGRTVVG